MFDAQCPMLEVYSGAGQIDREKDKMACTNAACSHELSTKSKHYAQKSEVSFDSLRSFSYICTQFANNLHYY